MELGSNAHFSGFPIVLIRGGAKVRVGNNLRMTSKSISNPAGLPHKCIISALGEDARILMGDNLGLSGVSINCRSKIIIGDDVLIGAGAIIWDTDFHPTDPEARRINFNGGASAPVIIEDDVFIGARAMILKGVTIGKASVVAAGAVVTKSVPPGHVAYGNPAKIKKL